MEVGVLVDVTTGSVLVVVDVLITGGVEVAVAVDVAVEVVATGGMTVVEVGMIIGGISLGLGGVVSRSDVEVAAVLDDVQIGSPFVPNVAR